MLCRIADLIVEVPEAGGMASRCREYFAEAKGAADIVIQKDLYKPNRFPYPDEDTVAYMESFVQFCSHLLKHNGLYLHASAVELNGKAYLFSGPSGTGKSTHTRLWKMLVPDARIFNDDKPILRYLDGCWYAYGTPWCGKDGININMKVPLAGICFLKKGQMNEMIRLSPLEATARVISQTTHRFQRADRLDLMLTLVDRLVREIPIYELTNKPEIEAARLSYETMRHRETEIV